MDSVQDTLAGGFPHSEIFGSKLVRNSPKLIAAYHVLHRLSAPRHPPNALKTLDHSHCRYPSPRFQARRTATTGEKTSFFEICPIAGGLSVTASPCDRPGNRASDKPSLHDVIKRRRPKPPRNLRYADTDDRQRQDRPQTGTVLGCPVGPNVTPLGPQSSGREWWSQTGSNRRPPACKAGALPTELWPRPKKICVVRRLIMVGPGRLELPTSRLSGVRSNRLSYRPSRERPCNKGSKATMSTQAPVAATFTGRRYADGGGFVRPHNAQTRCGPF